MKNTQHLVLLIFLLVFNILHGQIPSEPWLRGYDDFNTGDFIGYTNGLKTHGPALLVRSQDEKKYIEWKTEAIPTTKLENYTFVWLAGYDSVKSPRKYKMYLNGKHYFTFTNNPTQTWNVKGPGGANLLYINTFMDQHNDFQGYHFLTVPAGAFKNGDSITIRVVGESKKQDTWYMVFMDKLKTSIKVVPEQALVQIGESLMQRVRIDITHHGEEKIVNISAASLNPVTDKLKLGRNTFYLPLQQVNEASKLDVKITIDNKPAETFPVEIRPVRKFTVYFLPHSHVDIGYTHTQDEVEKMQWSHFEKAMAIAEKTRDYPEGSRFKWNAEVFWAADGYLRNQPDEKKQKFMAAIKNGDLYLDALYGNVLTGIMRPEELFRMAGENVNDLYNHYGITIESAMISDVAGYTWSIVPALAQNGIKYFSSGPNHMIAAAHGGDRIGYTLEAWGDKPFYWESPSGKERVLFWVAAHGYSWFHGGNIGEVSKAGSAPILEYLDELDEEGYPYDMLYVRYTIGGDNGPPDPELPGFIKEWNETYVWPKLKIATTGELFNDFENKYGAQLPVLRGDFTPYWEDGAASSAHETALSRNATDKLLQGEVLWSLLHKKQDFPQMDFYKGWRNTILFSEHTWGANISVTDPDSKFTKKLWEVKQKMATDADSIAVSLINKALVHDGSNSSEITVFNTASWTRSEIVEIPVSTDRLGKALVDEEGNEVAIQPGEQGKLLLFAKDIPALGTSHYHFVDALASEIARDGFASTTGLSNGIAQIKIDTATGALTHVSLVKDGSNLIDENADYLANTYIYTGKNASNPRTSRAPKITVTKSGPLVYEIKIEFEAPGANSLVTTIQLHHGSDIIYITNTVDKQDIREKENVRFAFPFNVNCGEMTMDLAWAAMTPEKDQLEGANKNYFTVQRWIDISSEDQGITWACPDAPIVEIGGMYGEAWMKDPTRPYIKVHQPSQRIFSWVMNNSWHTNYKASQDGFATFRYMIKPHAGPLDFAATKKFGIDVCQPLIATYGKYDITNQVLNPSDGPVIVTSLRPHENGKGYVVRLFNTTQKYRSLRLDEWITGEKKTYLSNARNEKLDPIEGVLGLGGWEIKTIYVED